MKCVCPKCSALLSEKTSLVDEKGKSGKCSECSGSYWIHRESFILRCYTVRGERYCAGCGEELGESTYCPGCGTLYPDYCIVHSKKPVPRAAMKKSFSLNLSLSGGAGKASSKEKKESLTSLSDNVVRSNDLRSQLIKVGGVIALLAVIAVIGYLYMQDRAESKFSKNFVAVLYGIKSGTDQCLKLSELLANGTPLSDKDIALLKSVKAENAAALQILSTPPEKFAEAQSRLVQLAATYEKLNNLCINSGPSTTVAATADNLETQFNAQAKDLRSALHPKLLAELKEKSSRLTSLQFMLN